MECVFCKIINKQAESYTVYESDNIIAILDIDPINEGHILLIPKMHVESIEKIPVDVLHEIMVVSQKVVEALKDIYHMDGYTVMQNGGEFCDFGHAHFHIFPRYKNDGFGWVYPEGPFECSGDVAEKLKNAMK